MACNQDSCRYLCVICCTARSTGTIVLYYSIVCNVLCIELVLLYSHVIIDSLGLYAPVGKVLREEGCRVLAVDTKNMTASRDFMPLIRFTGMKQCGTLLHNKMHCRTALFDMIATVESLLQHLKGRMYAPFAHSSAFAFAARTLAACDGAHIIDQEHISRYLCATLHVTDAVHLQVWGQEDVRNRPRTACNAGREQPS